MLLPLLLLLPLIARFSVEALQCYDCLSKALPECTDGSRVEGFDKAQCEPDENFCSLLVMKDTTGEQFVSRQCASRPDEGEQLKSYIAGTVNKELRVVSFRTCVGDLCNTQNANSATTGSSGKSGNAVGHEGHGPHDGHAGHGGTGNAVGPHSALPAVLIVCLAMIAANFVCA